MFASFYAVVKHDVLKHWSIKNLKAFLSPLSPKHTHTHTHTDTVNAYIKLVVTHPVCSHHSVSRPGPKERRHVATFTAPCSRTLYLNTQGCKNIQSHKRSECSLMYFKNKPERLPFPEIIHYSINFHTLFFLYSF